MGRAAPGGVAVALFDGMGANDMSSPLSSDLCYTIYNIQTSVRPPKNKFRISTSGESSGRVEPMEPEEGEKTATQFYRPFWAKNLRRRFITLMDWQRLAGTYGDRVYLVARSILRDETMARDVAQETLLKIGKALNGSASVKDYDGWVLSIAGNAARDALRQKRRRREVAMEQDVVDDRSPEGALLAKESRERLTRALETMPVGARDILLLKFREGLSGPQIASALGLSMTAAWQQMSRAMKLLRSKLTEPT